MKREDIYTLLEKYFEGMTSLQEEQTLRDYFRQDEVDEELKEYQPMFRFFADEIESRQSSVRTEETHPSIPVEATQPKSGRIQWLRWTAIGAAACLALALTIRVFFTPASLNVKESYAYVDGKKYTDVAIIKQQALESLESFSEDDHDVLSSQIEMLDSFFDE